jgi:hypothetical protein
VALYRPDAQLKQLVDAEAPVVETYFPDGHKVQVVDTTAPVNTENVPAEQLAQLVDPVRLVYLPAAQYVHVDDAAPEYEPA